MIDTDMNPRPRAESRSLSRATPANLVRRWLIALCLCASALVALAPSPARAQEEEIKQDARLEGYANAGGNVSVPNQSTALIWLLFVFLGVVALAALFKDAKRSHLD